LISEVEDRVEKDLNFKDSVVYFINGSVTYIKSDERSVYDACPSCKKKVNREDETSFRCERCDMTTEKPVATYMLTAKIEDSSGALFVRFYNNQAPAIMGETTPKQF